MLTLFHGTSYDRGCKIINSQLFKPSKGDRHWLGDGIYFYDDKFYAIRWIYISYRDEYGNGNIKISDLVKKYVVLSADIYVDKERIFDLSEYNHKLLFDKIYNNTITRLENSNLKIVDGAVFNLMFYKMNYKEKYDMIKAIFLHEDNDISIQRTRLAYIPEVQYCVVNREIIKNIIDINISEEDADTFSLAQHYNDNGNGRLIKYKPQKRGYIN